MDTAEQAPAVAWRDRGEIATRDQWRGYLSLRDMTGGEISLSRHIKAREVFVHLSLTEYVEQGNEHDLLHGDINISGGMNLHLTEQEWILFTRAINEAMSRRRMWRALRTAIGERDDITSEQFRLLLGTMA